MLDNSYLDTRVAQALTEQHVRPCGSVAELLSSRGPVTYLMLHNFFE